MEEDLAAGIEEGDDVGVGEIAAGIFFEFDSEEGCEFEDVVGVAAEKGPVRWKFVAGAECGENWRGIAIGIEGYENEADVGAEVLGKCSFDAFHVVDEDGAGIGAGAEEHGDDVRAPLEGGELDWTGDVIGPGGVKVEEGVVR